MKRIAILCCLAGSTWLVAQQAELDHVIAAYEKAVQGDTKAQVELGDRYFKGRGVSKNQSMAAFWFQKAADLGNGTGANNLGFLYENGYGVPQDAAKAAQRSEERRVGKECR